MGLFSKLRKAEPANNQNLSKAVLMPSVMTMIADGSVDDSDLAQLSNLCSFSPIFAGQPGEVTMSLIKELANELLNGDIGALLARTKAELTMPMRETAVLFAMRIAMADGHLDEGEKKSLLVLGQQFEIPENKFMVMFDVVSIMQIKGSTV